MIQKRKDRRVQGLGGLVMFIAYSPFALAAPGLPVHSERSFARLVDGYFQLYFETHPTAATEAGFHQYDGNLENFSPAALKKIRKSYSSFEKQIQKIDPKILSLESAVDRESLHNHIRAQILELQTLQPWKKDPDYYGTLASKSIFGLISRRFAPLETRMLSIIARERKLPTLFRVAARNLSNPPPLFVKIALSQLEGTLHFFEIDVPFALKEVKSPSLQQEFRKTHSKVLQALAQYKSHLTVLLPQARGEYALGAKTFSLLLRYKEGIETPLSELLEIGHRNLAENQKLFQETLSQLKLVQVNNSPDLTLPDLRLDETFVQYSKDHPNSSQLIPEIRLATEQVKAFLSQKAIITIPPGPSPSIQETPAFQRELTDASMETPGLYERNATESFFYVTLPNPIWPANRIEEYLQTFNRPRLAGLSVHELYPGHYLQYLVTRELRSKVRKLIYSEANSEGWAHYCEQMMLDEGFQSQNPSMRLGQLQDALLRNARFIVAIELHTGKMTLQQAVRFFETEGRQSHATAEREAERGTSDPTYLTYTLGKLQILQLREDYRKSQGPWYSLKQFHDEFLKQGPLSIPLVRKQLSL